MLHLLHRAVENHAERAPDHEAIRFAGSALTYGELADGAGRLAWVLRDQGVVRGDRVGILANKGLHTALAIHGIMKSGAAYVPLDASAPVDRLVLIAKDCGITHLVSEATKSGTVQAMIDGGLSLRTVIGFDGPPGTPGPGLPWEQVQCAPLLSDIVGATELDLAYILYTSGSTGVPKGVVHTHRSALSFAEVAADTFGLLPEDRVTNHAPLHFDLSTLDFFATAVAGGTTVVIPEAHTRLPASLAQLLEEEKITVLYAVPLALTQLALYGALEKRDLSSLRLVLFGGEPFPPKHLRALMQALPRAGFSNVYGPTEVNGVTYWFVPPTSVEGDSDDPLPIGRPFANVDLMVIAEDGTPAAPSTLGELWVRSPTMMQGYWARPDLDETAFGVRPSRAPRGLTFHKTGDLVSQDADGVFHFFGRKDRQIKARGHRVELDEVESVFTRHPGVETAAVYGVPDDHGSTSIEASIVLAPGSSASVAELLNFAAQLLPRYALPHQVHCVDELPRTASDKIDRVTLRARALERRTHHKAGRSQ